jgi:cytochrome o ubiquinol oxidase subunit II
MQAQGRQATRVLRGSVSLPGWRAAGSRSRSLGLRLTAALLALPLAGCEGNILDPKGPIAAAERTMLLNSVFIMLAIIVPTMIATVAFAWWFRDSNKKAHYRPDWEFSGAIELAVWGVPLLTIIFLGGIGWIGSHDVDPAVPIQSKNKTLDVQVVALDWKWLFIYPDQHVASVNQLVVPVDTPLHLTLTSSSVWNSFYVPRIGSQIYTMKGMATQLNLLASEPGDFFGLSTHFSGDGFSKMTFTMKSVPSADFESWVKTAQGSGPVLDQAAYIQLEQQSIGDKPRTYQNPMPDLFQQVIAEKLPAGPGPHGGEAPDITPKGGS